MKINKINIASFGKFKNKQIEFSDGFNLIYGENEMGKTTVMEFIKMMFYGSKVKGGDSVTNPRKRYMPWNSDNMAGSIEFTHGGTFYRLEREFKGGNSTDKVTLWNLDTGKSENFSGSDEIGAKFFGISAGAFEKSVFIANDPAFSADASADAEINARLSKLTASYDDDTSLQQVASHIADAENMLLTKTGRGGSIIKLEAEKSALIAEQAENEALCREREELEQQVDELRAEIAKITDLRKDYFERIKDSEKSELKEKLNQFISAAEMYEQTENGIKNENGELITNEILDEASEKLSKLKAYEAENITIGEEVIALTDEINKLSHFDNKNQVEELEKGKSELLAEFEECEAKIKEAEMNIMSASNEKENMKSKPNAALIIAGALLLAVGIVLAFTVNNYCAGLCLLGAALTIFGILKKKKTDSSKIQDEISAFEAQKQKFTEQKNAVSGKMQELSEKLNSACVDSSANEKLIDAKRQENIRKREKQLENVSKCDAIRRELFALLTPFGCPENSLSAEKFIKNAAASLSQLQVLRVKAENAAVGTKCVNLKEAKEKLALLGEISSNENSADLKEKLAKATEDKAALENKLAALTSKAKNAFKNLKTPIEYTREIENIDEKISSQKSYYEVLKIAHDALNTASARLRRNFSGIIETRALEIFSGITNGRYTDVAVSENFDINLQSETDFGSHNVLNMSRGTVDQAYFALRLALYENIGKENGGLPIFLDDVFSQYDDMRAEQGFKYLSGYSENGQIIFFTCHSTAKNQAEQNGAAIIKL